MSIRFLATLACCCGLFAAGCKDSGPPPAANVGATQKDSDSGVVLLRYKAGSESTEQRERGFLETMEKEFPDIKVISSDQHAGLTSLKSKEMAIQLVNKYGDRMEGLFAVCEPNAAGALQALEEKGVGDDFVFVGFDPNERMVEAVRDGKMAGIVLQDPVTMGYLAVKTMVQHLDGEEVEPRVPTGEFVVTPENVDSDDEIKRLVNPPKFTGDAFTPPETQYRIAVIPKGTSHEFWQSVHFGAEKAAKELGNVEVLWQGPQSEGDVAQQIQIVNSMKAKKVDGICLAPNDSVSLVAAVQAAKEAGVPTVVYDSGLDAPEGDFVSYVATDNYNGGALAARTMAAALKSKTTTAKDGSSSE